MAAAAVIGGDSMFYVAVGEAVWVYPGSGGSRWAGFVASLPLEQAGMWTVAHAPGGSEQAVPWDQIQPRSQPPAASTKTSAKTTKHGAAMATAAVKSTATLPDPTHTDAAALLAKDLLGAAQGALFPAVGADALRGVHSWGDTASVQLHPWLKVSIDSFKNLSTSRASAAFARW